MASPAVFRHEAMATWFELRTHEADTTYAGQAAAEAFHLLDHLEGLLSRFRETSDIRAISGLRPGETLKLHSDVAECLAFAVEMERLTGGAFNPCLGPLPQGTTRGRLRFDAETQEVTVTEGTISLDLGAVGKGWALDKLAQLLTEWEIGPTLLVGGGSSLLAVGTPPEPWKIALTTQCHIQLHTGSVGCSGYSVKGRHIIDPRKAAPAVGPARAWALSGSAGVSDALSTAFMILNPAEIQTLLGVRPEAAAIIQNLDTSDDLLHLGKALGVHHAVVRSGGAIAPPRTT